MTAQEAVLVELRKAIASRELKPGGRIRQDAVADLLGVSRVPVREALKILEAEGQVQYEPHRGYKVTELELDDVHELYLMRRLLESEAIRQAVPKIDDALLGRLGHLVERMAVADEADDIASFTALNREFHFALYEQAQMPRLLQYLGVLWQNSDPHRSAFFATRDVRRRMQHEHAMLLDACRVGDVAAAIAVMDMHRANAVTYVKEQFAAEDEESGHADGAGF